MTKKILSEVYESKNPFSFSEDVEQTGAKKYLGKVVGQFFVPNGASRNGRFYTKEFWESVIARPEIKTRLANGLMGGQIGHKDTPVSDEDWNKGEVSHKITRLWIETDPETGELKGMAEAIIFDTPSGRNLKAYLLAETKLYTSSRASGDYKEGKEVNGLPVVDESTYYLDTFDFVLNPGFLQAQPSLIENYNKDGSKKMNEEEIKALIQKSIKEALPQPSIPVANESGNKLQEDFNALKAKVTFLESWDSGLLEAVKSLSASEVSEMITGKVKLTGDVRQVSYTHEGFSYEGVFLPTKFTNSESIGKVHNALSNENLEKYPTLVLSINKKENAYFGGNGVAILWRDKPKTALESVKNAINNNAGLVFEGVGVSYESNLSELKKYKALGTPEKIAETLETIDKDVLPEYEAFLKVGSVEEVKQLETTLESLVNKIEPLGNNLGVIEKALKTFKVVQEKYNKGLKLNKLKALEAKAKTLSNRFELPLESVSKALKKMGEANAIDFFKSITKVESEAKKGNTKPNSNESNKSREGKSLIDRINESYIKPNLGGK